MNIVDKKKMMPHHPGHDGGGATAHVCHQCGWALPNPHPSAKLRRAHKRQCGKIPGFEVGEKKVSEEEEDRPSDDDARSKNESQKELWMREMDDEKGGVVELVEKSAGLEENVLDSHNDTIETYDLADGNHLGVPEMGTVVDQSDNDNDMQLEEKSVCDCSVLGINIDQKETSLIDGLEKRPYQPQAQNQESSLASYDKHVGACVRNDTENNEPLVPVLPGYLASEAELLRQKGYAETTAETNLADGSGIGTREFPDERCASRGEVDPEASKTENGQNKSGKLYDNGFRSSAKSCLVESARNLEAFADFAQSDFVSEMTDSWSVKEKENASATSRPVIVPLAEISSDLPQSEYLSEMFPNPIGKENEDKKKNATLAIMPLFGISSRKLESIQNKSLLSSGVGAVKDPKCQLEDKDPKVVKPKLVAAELQQSEDSDLPNKQLQEVNFLVEVEESKIVLNESNKREMTKDGHGSGERSLVKDFQVVADVALPDYQEGTILDTDEVDANGCSTIEGSPVAAMVGYDAPLRGSCKLEVLPSQFEEMKKEFTSERQELSYSNEAIAERENICIGHVTVPFASELDDVMKELDGNQVVDNDEMLVNSIDTVKEYKQATLEDHSCSEAEVNAELTSDIPQLMLLSDGYTRPIELEKNQDLASSILPGCPLSSKSVDSNSQSMINSARAHSDEVGQSKTLQDRSAGLCVDNSLNNDVIEVEVPTQSNGVEESCNEWDYKKVQTEHLGSLSRSISDELGCQENTSDDMIELAVSIDDDHPKTEKDVQTGNTVIESARCGSEETSEPYSDRQVHQEAVQDNITGHLVCTDTDQSVVKVARAELSSTDLDVGSQDQFMAGKDVEGQVAVTPIPDHIEDIDVTHTSEGAIFGMFDQFPRQKFNHIVYDHPTEAVLVATHTSSDSNSQVDSMEGQWGSISEATIPPTRHVSDGLILGSETIPSEHSHSLKELNAFNTAKKVIDEGNSIESMDLFEAPSFMTLVDAGNFPVSSEIRETKPLPPQADQHPSVLNSGHESTGRGKNEEITSKLMSCSSSKPHVPLKILLVEANLESKQKAGKVQDLNVSQATKKGRVLQDTNKPASELVSEKQTSSFNKVDQKEWNSPAKLPTRKNEKGRSKGRPIWVPFICCPSLN